MVIVAYPHARTRLKAKMADLETKLNPPVECPAGLRCARHITLANKLQKAARSINSDVPIKTKAIQARKYHYVKPKQSCLCPCFWPHTGHHPPDGVCLRMSGLPATWLSHQCSL